LQTVSDEGVRLWLGGQLLIDNWGAHTEATDTAQVSLQGGQEYDIRIEFYERTDSAMMQLMWQTPDNGSMPPVPVPSGQLLPPSSPPVEVPGDNPTSDTLVYLHSDHLGSVSAATDASGAAIGRQVLDPWGKVLTPGGTPTPGPVTQTRLNYTGQKKDDTGLLYYHARMYDPALGRFVSPDSIVPGASSGVGGTFGTVGQEENSKLTVDFHESGFLMSAAGENTTTLLKGFWFQLSGEDRQNAREPWGPSNPQALGRYTYTLDNPLQYVDPTGHKKITVRGGKAIAGFITQVGSKISTAINMHMVGMGIIAAAGCALTGPLAGGCAAAAAASIATYGAAASEEKDALLTVLGYAADFAGDEGYIEVIQDDKTGEVTVVAHNARGQTQTYTNLGNGPLIDDRNAFIHMSNAATEARRLLPPSEQGDIHLDFYWP
jgi:RHS repeat-associated protein